MDQKVRAALDCGNAKFLEARQNMSSGPAVLAVTGMKEALKDYTEAERLATCARLPGSLASAAKNQSKAAGHIVNLVPREEAQWEYYVSYALAAAGRALKQSDAGGKDDAWTGDLVQHILLLVDGIFRAPEQSSESGMHRNKMIRLVEQIVHKVPEVMKLILAEKLVVAVYHPALKYFEQGDCAHSSRLSKQFEGLFSATASLELGSLRGSMGELMTDIKESLLVSFQDLVYLWESIDAQLDLERGKEHVVRSIDQSEELNMDGVFLALDAFRSAVTHAKKNGAVRAEADACIGRLYARVLMNQDRAAAYYGQAVATALSMHPMSFENRAWFAEARGFLEERQMRKSAKEEEEKRKQNESFIRMRQEEHDKIAEADEATEDDPDAFISKVIEQFPDIISTQQQKAVRGARSAKKRLLKFVVFFHPDKHAGKPKDHQVLMEEVCKRLTRRYEGLKMEGMTD